MNLILYEEWLEWDLLGEHIHIYRNFIPKKKTAIEIMPLYVQHHCGAYFSIRTKVSGSVVPIIGVQSLTLP